MQTPSVVLVLVLVLLSLVFSSFVNGKPQSPPSLQQQQQQPHRSGVENFRSLYTKGLVVEGELKTSPPPPNSLPFVSNTLGSNMVLQQAPRSAVLWGWTSGPSALVSVSLNQVNVVNVTSASDDGFWSAELPPTSASFTPYTISLSSSLGDSATLSNVLFGDVYLCSGQSNMQFTVSEGFNASTEIQDANNFPNIRVFTVGQSNISLTEVPNLLSIEQSWSVASNTSIGGPDWGYFSAVCWFFVRDLYLSQNIPIGAISTNWGGTIVQAWSSPDALNACPSNLPPSQEEEQLQQQQEEEEPVDPNQNSVLWNAMVVPYLPMAVRGAVWYQGEGNIFQPAYYACAFPAMIADWRVKFGSQPSDFGFFFVQLAAYTEGTYLDGLALTRLAQTAALNLPNVGMATAIDLGDLGSPQGNIHPRDKQTVGARLVLNALYFNYQQETLYTGPFPVNTHLGPAGISSTTSFSSSDDTNSITLSIPFNEPLVLLPNVTCPPAIWATNCTGFELQTSDGTWHSATNVTVDQGNDGSNLLITAAQLNPLLVPWGVRYAFSNWPLASLWGSDSQLPATPFIILFQLETADS